MDIYGIFIPLNELLENTHYNWFCYISEKELFNSSNIYITKYFIQNHL